MATKLPAVIFIALFLTMAHAIPDESDAIAVAAVTEFDTDTLVDDLLVDGNVSLPTATPVKVVLGKKYQGYCKGTGWYNGKPAAWKGSQWNIALRPKAFGIQNAEDCMAKVCVPYSKCIGITWSSTASGGNGECNVYSKYCKRGRNLGSKSWETYLKDECSYQPTSRRPTAAPTGMPTEHPTAAPTLSPTIEPTEKPTLNPTAAPTELPTAVPTGSPTDVEGNFSGFFLKTSGRCTTSIRAMADCNKAATQLGLSDRTATDDRQNGVTYDPPGCYFEGQQLKLNVLMSNKGACTTVDQCVCACPSSGCPVTRAPTRPPTRGPTRGPTFPPTARIVPMKPCGKVDVSIVIDSSGSVKNAEWDQQMVFTKKLLFKLGIASEDVHAGIIMFSGSNQVKVVSNLVANKKLLLAKLAERPYNGNTYFATALARAQTMLQGGRSGAKKMVMMLTDGRPGDGAATASRVSQLKSAGYVVMMVLIKGIKARDVVGWTTVPPVEVLSFSALSQALGTVSQNFCQTAQATKWTTPTPTSSPTGSPSRAPLAAAPAGAFVLKTSGRCTHWIRTIAECNQAAAQLRLRDRTAADDRQTGVTYDPPGCYYEGNQLKLNVRMDNRGSCTSSDRCLCKTPTAAPTDPPTDTPTEIPTYSPTPTPTGEPSDVPTPSPTEVPTPAPTAVPTFDPTLEPSHTPTPSPTVVPTLSPTRSPTLAPTPAPSSVPTKQPTTEPTQNPTPNPSAVPTVLVQSAARHQTSKAACSKETLAFKYDTGYAEACRASPDCDYSTHRGCEPCTKPGQCRECFNGYTWKKKHCDTHSPTRPPKQSPAESTPCMTSGGNAGGAKCEFPFTYRGTSHTKCINEDHTALWCYTAGGKWGNCADTASCNGRVRRLSFGQNNLQLGTQSEDAAMVDELLSTDKDLFSKISQPSLPI